MSIKRRAHRFYSEQARPIRKIEQDFAKYSRDIAYITAEEFELNNQKRNDRKKRIQLPKKPIIDENEAESLERIGRDTHETVEEGLVNKGFDFIAYYQPYHYFGSNWGIYYYKSKLCGLAYSFARNTGDPFDEIFHLCTRAIFEHEALHFRVEYFSFVAEGLTRRPLYTPFRAHAREEDNTPWSNKEEALANAYIFSSKANGLGLIKEYMRELCRISPAGYRDFHCFLMGKAQINEQKVLDFLNTEILRNNNSQQIWFPFQKDLSSHLIQWEVPQYFI